MSEHIGETWRRPGPTVAQRRNDLWIGAAMVAGAMLFVVLVSSFRPLEQAPSLAEHMLWAVAMTLPLCFRRRWPEAVALLVGAAMIAAQARTAAGDNQFASIACFFALYTVGAWGQDRARARLVRVVVIVAMFGWLAISLATGLSADPALFEDVRGPLDPMLAVALWNIGFNLMYFLSAYYFGNVGWESARRHHELAVRAEELRRSQQENARRAVLDERVRIARDLHDVVAHHVSVMGIQASAARRVLDTDRSLAERCLRTVEDTARGAVAELHGLLGVLRSGDTDADDGTEGGATLARTTEDGGGGTSDYASSPGLDQLQDLVRELRTAGFTVDFDTYGDPRPVPASIALSVYRVVQEALTNTTKHAGFCNVEVRLRYLASAIEVEVDDDGRGVDLASRRTGTLPAAHGGYGLVGMRERVTVHGGVLEAGPRRTGGFQVRARFPLEPALVSETTDG